MRTRRDRISQVRRAKVIAEHEVDLVFDATNIQCLAKIAKLPAGADLKAFAEGIAQAAGIYAREARAPNRNELHDEISNLHDLADSRQFEATAMARETLTRGAVDLLKDQNFGKARLPSADALRDIESRETACEAVAALCRYGGVLVPGRRRSSGKRSRPRFEPLLHAPERSRNFPKRAAERNFVMWLGVAYFDAGGKPPPRKARHIARPPKTLGELAKARDRKRSRHTTLGPFANFAKKCLELARSGNVDVVGLINSLDSRTLEGSRGVRGKPATG
jgi:hypothetical protein